MFSASATALAAGRARDRDLARVEAELVEQRFDLPRFSGNGRVQDLDHDLIVTRCWTWTKAAGARRWLRLGLFSALAPDARRARLNVPFSLN